MPGFLRRLMPHDGDFFVLFQKQAENIVAGAQAFTNMLSHYAGVPEQVQIIKAIEHNGDEITHQIFRKLNQTFITPFDREDMHEPCSTYPSEADCNYQVLRKQGVPAKAIHILESSILNTADELDVISVALQDTGSQSVIVVTDKPHTRRVHTLWKEFDAGRGNVIVHGVSGDLYVPASNYSLKLSSCFG